MAGEDLFISTTGLNNNHRLIIKDSAGNEVSSNHNAFAGTLDFTPTTSGTYYVAVEQRNEVDAEIVDYTLSTEVPDDFEDDATTTGLVDLADTTSGSIEFVGDEDWFAVTLADNESLRVYDGNPVLFERVSFELLNSDGSVARTGISVFDGGPVDTFVFDDLDAGTYYISVTGPNGSSSQDYNFVARTFFDDHGDDIATATALANGAISANGIFETPSDEDWFSIEIAAGESVEFSKFISPTADVSTVLFDASGNIVSGAVNTGGATFNYTGYSDLAAGTYYVRAEGQGFVLANAGYSFNINQYVDDHGDTAATATSLARLNGQDTGVLSAATDDDVFTVDLVAGEVFHFTTTGLPGGFNQVQVTRNGAAVDVGEAPHVTSFSFTPTVTDTYEITISLDPNFAGSAPALYTVSTAIPDDFGDTAGTAGNLSFGGRTIGSIESDGDTDWFEFSIGQGQGLQVSGLNDDISLRILNADGTLVNAGQTYFDATTLVRVFDDLDAGTFFLEVSNVGTNHPADYNLSTTTINDDYGDTIDEAVSLNFIQGRLETPFDTDWFEVDVQVGQDGIFEISTSSFPIDARELALYDSNGNQITQTTTGVTNVGFALQYEGLTDGTYFLEVLAAAGAERSQFYSVETLSFVDDHGGDAVNASILPLEGSIDGVLDGALDEDWFSINLTAGEDFRVNSTGFTLGSMGVWLLDADGNSVAGGNFQRATDFVFTPNESGQYHVVVGRAINYASASSTDYTLTIGIPDDFAGDSSTTGVVNLVGETTGVFENVAGVTDVDWFAVDVEAGETLEISYPTFTRSFSIVDSSGNVVPGLFDGSRFLNFTATESDTYYVTVTEFTEQVDAPYSFTALKFVDDYAGDSSTTGVLVPESSVTGEYQSANDVDWIAITIVAGQTVKIDFNQNYYQTDIRLVNASGQTLATEQLNGSDGTSFVTYTANTSGIYYVQTQSNNFTSVQPYELSAKIIAPDIPGNTSSTATIALGETVNSIFEGSYEADWFGFSVEAGDIIRFTLDSVYGDRTNLFAYSETGSFVQSGSFSLDANTEIFTFIAPQAGNYFIGAQVNYLPSNFTEYSLTMTEVVDDFAGDASTTGTLAVGGSISGEIDLRNDVDWIAVDMSEGDFIRFNIEADFTGITLVDSNGTRVASAIQLDEGYGIEVIAPSTDTFYLQVTNFQEGFDYTITAETIVDDFAGDSTTTGIVQLDGSVTGSTDFVGDQDWFAITVGEGENIFATLTDTDADPSAMRIRLFDDAGNRLADTGGYTNFSELTYAFATAGTYYISVEGYSFPSYTNLSVLSDYELDVFSVDLLGTAGSDILTGTSGDDTIVGLDSRDLIQGFEGDDTILGGGGSDRIEGGAGADHIDGGSNNDYIAFSSSDAGVTVNLETGTGSVGHAEGDTYVNVEWIIGSSFDDTLIGDANFNFFVGADGADVMTGGGSIYQSDNFTYRRVTGQMDGDVITDFGFNDQIGMFTVWENDTFVPNFIGNDAFSNRVGEIRYEISGNDTLLHVDVDGDGQVDETLTLQGYTGTLSMNVDFTIFAQSAFVFDNNDNFYNGNANDEIIAASGGNDTILGFGGDDIIEGGAGDDYIDGGDGNDTAAYRDATSRVIVDLGFAGPQDTQGAGLDALVGIENVTGSDFNEILFGNGGDNVLDGGAGNDYIMGGDGDDTIIGGEGVSDWATYFSATAGVTVDLTISGPQDTIGAGIDTLSGIENLEGSSFADTLTGDAGNNYLDGRNGSDLLEGGDGNDTIDGGANSNGLGDFVTYATASSGVVVDLSITGAQNTIGAGIDIIRNIENLGGSTHDDILTGDANDNIIIGGLGDDIMDGGAGTDWVSYFVSTAGITADLSLTGPQDTGIDGFDTLSGFENLAGSAFDDTLSGDGGDNTILGYTGNDVISGGGGVDMLDGMEGDDIIFGGDGDDAFGGDEGMDVLDGGAGNDFLDGGADTDMASYGSATGRVFVNLSISGPQNTGGAGIDVLISIEQLEGSDFRDTLIGNAGSNVILGGDGGDFIDGGESGDLLDGGDGVDWVSYFSAMQGVIVDLSDTGVQNTGAGPDIILNFENLEGSRFSDMLYGDDGDNFIDGQSGNDYIRGGLGNDILFGGQGASDWASYAAAMGSVIVDLGLTTAQDTISDGIDTLLGFENLEGSAFNDSLTGTTGSNVIDGMDGDDFIFGIDGNNLLLGGDGNDDIFGGDGMDFLDGGMGDDTLDGGNGPDMASFASATGRVIVDLSISGPQNTRGAGTDTLISIEQLEGSAFNDILFGDGRSNYVLGGNGNDFIDGGASGDYLDGGAGTDWVSYQSELGGVTIDLSNTGVQATNDIILNFENLEGSDFGDNLAGDSGANFIDAQDGGDTINGRAGNDFLMGGSGNDLFVFDTGFGSDRVLDYQDGADQIQFRIAGLTQFSQLSVTQSGADTLISYDGNSVRLTGITATDITSADVAFAAPPAPAEPHDSINVVSQKLTNPDVVSEKPDSFDFKTDVDSTPIAEVMSTDGFSDPNNDLFTQILEIGAEAEPDPLTYINDYGILSIVTADEDAYWDMVG